ncbi:MAG: PEP-CTERM sorting domain-containing protein [Massilia sp.]|nr:PEP-CTERM sorting domain-containing protein [Massilia sp.]
MKKQILVFSIFSAMLASGGMAQAGASNVAVLGTASQSSYYSGSHNFVAANAIDGNTDGASYNNSITHTMSGMGYLVGNGLEWWSDKLDQAYNVGNIVIWNRTDCCTGRLKNFTVSLFNQGALAWSGVYSAADGPLPSVSFAVGAIGDQVMVQLNQQNYLSLAEVQVFGTSAVPEPETYAMLLTGLGLMGFTLGRRKTS